MPRSANSRKRRTAKEWGRILRQLRSSGLSRAEFCRREGIPLSSFDRWRQRVEPETTPDDFVELAAAPTARPESWELEVALPNGVHLRFRG
jgi:transposase-like protein